MKYKQLTMEKRYHISTLIKQGYKQKEIAIEIGVSASTISRELKRNSSGTYHPEHAQISYHKRLIKKNKRSSITALIEKYIRSKLKLDWSPEQIAGRIRIDKGLGIHHETIYRFIYSNKANNGRLYLHLRHKNKKYHKRTQQYQRRGTIKNRVCISTRPKIVDRKSRIGDWEIDTVIGANHQGALVTIVDRKSKFSLITKVNSKHADVVTQATIDLLYPLRRLTHTITSDNGKEFAYHEVIAKTLDTSFYFANPFHSWERGLNEHTNGLIRQYIPKKSEFANISKEEIVTIANKLNHRPRKSLGYKTPFEVFMNAFLKKMSA
jgi:IS30 family transposase